MNHLSRIFLNKKEGMAAMQTDMAVEGSYVEASILMSDCNRQVTIDLSSHNAKGFNERLAKLDAIVQQLLLLQYHMAEFKASPEFKKVFK